MHQFTKKLQLLGMTPVWGLHPWTPLGNSVPRSSGPWCSNPINASEEHARRLYGDKVKSPDIYIPPLTGKLEQQRFTVRRGVLTSISSRHHSAIARTNGLWTRSLQLDRPTCVAGPVCWNSLPDYLKSSDLSFNCFRQQLKTFLFGKYWYMTPVPALL